jgi:hypothetical protein
MKEESSSQRANVVKKLLKCRHTVDALKTNTKVAEKCMFKLSSVIIAIRILISTYTKVILTRNARSAKPSIEVELSNNVKELRKTSEREKTREA